MIRTNTVFRKQRGRLLLFVNRHLFGFGILDAIYLVCAYAVGSYLLFDVPAYLVLFVLSYHLVTSEKESLKKVSLFLIFSMTVSVTLSGFLFYLFNKFSSVNYNLRIFHQLGARGYLLILLPYLIEHGKMDLKSASLQYQAVAKAGWLLLKISFWVGAFPALLSIQGKTTSFHVFFFLLSVPFLVVHIFGPSWKRGEGEARATEILPDSMGEVGSKPLVLYAALSGVVFTVLIGVFPTTGFERSGSTDYMIAEGLGDYLPSPATTSGNVHYKSTSLGRSNSCGISPCHPYVYAEWIDSPHRHTLNETYMEEAKAAVTALGVPAYRVCAGCHDPISLYGGEVAFGRSIFSPDGIREGISCILCHSIYPNAEEPSNGSFLLRFPQYYYQGPHTTLFEMLSLWGEHEEDFLPPGYADDGLCVGCHRIRPLEDSDYPELDRWLAKTYHRQPKMIRECRGSRGCLKCHMPRSSMREKPGGPKLPDHKFGAVMDPSAGPGD